MNVPLALNGALNIGAHRLHQLSAVRAAERPQQSRHPTPREDDANPVASFAPAAGSRPLSQRFFGCKHQTQQQSRLQSPRRVLITLISICDRDQSCSQERKAASQECSSGCSRSSLARSRQARKPRLLQLLPRPFASDSGIRTRSSPSTTGTILSVFSVRPKSRTGAAVR